MTRTVFAPNSQYRAFVTPAKRGKGQLFTSVAVPGSGGSDSIYPTNRFADYGAIEATIFVTVCGLNGRRGSSDVQITSQLAGKGLLLFLYIQQA